MRVAIVTSKHPAFDKRLYERQGRFLAGSGLEVHLVAPGAPEGPTADGIILHSVPQAHGWVERLRLHPAIGDCVRRIAPDIVHFHDPDLLLSLHARRGRNCPVVVYDAHEDFPLATRSSRSSRGIPPGIAQVLAVGVDVVERVLARRVEGVVCAHRRRLRQLRPGPRGLYLPNYPSLEAFGTPAPAVARERSCVYLGLLSRERGAEMLLEGARLAPDVRWLVVGDFSPDEGRQRFLARARAEGLRNLEWVGMIPYGEVPAVLARAGVGLMPWQATPQHRWAAQPTKLYEYLAAGLPVVASRLEVTEEVVTQSGAGLLHPADNPEAMVACVRRVLDDPAGAAEFGRAGRHAFLTSFNYERLGTQLLDFYNRILHARRS